MMKENNEEKIYSILSSIDTTLKKQGSSKRVFMQGLLRGLGTALGATVLLAIVTSITIHFAAALDWSFIAESFFNEAVE